MNLGYASFRATGPFDGFFSSLNEGVYMTSDAVEYTERLLSTVPVDRFYTGAVLVRTGPERAVVTGRQSVVAPDEWEISNGLIKLSSSDVDDAMIRMDTRLFDGSAWSPRDRRLTVYDYNASIDTDWPYRTPIGMTVRRLDPEESSVSLRYRASDYDIGTVNVDITMRRGARHASVVVSSSQAGLYGLRYVAGFDGAGTAVTVGGATRGLRESDDAWGQQSILLGAQADLNFASGRVRSTEYVQSVELGVGYQSSGLYAMELAFAVTQQYMAGQSEVARVVAR